MWRFLNVFFVHKIGFAVKVGYNWLFLFPLRFAVVVFHVVAPNHGDVRAWQELV